MRLSAIICRCAHDVIARVRPHENTTPQGLQTTPNEHLTLDVARPRTESAKDVKELNLDQTDKARTRIIIANADPHYCDDMKEIIRQLNPDVEVVVISAADRQTAEPRRNMPEPAQLDRLSARQRDVLALIVEGHSNKDIARNLQIAPSTVRVHVSALLRVLGVKSRTAAAAMAAGTFARRSDAVRST